VVVEGGVRVGAVKIVEIVEEDREKLVTEAESKDKEDSLILG
jgi:hypothetical protein